MAESTTGGKKKPAHRSRTRTPDAAAQARTVRAQNYIGPVRAGEHARVDIRQTVYTQLSDDEEKRRNQEGELKQLRAAIREKYQVLERLVSQPLPAGNPFLFMQPFGIEDNSRFFGREEALHELLEHLKANHTTFLDGTGKTSVLQAGVIPALLKEGHLPLMVSVASEPLATSIKKQLLPNIEAMDFLRTMSLAEFIHRASDMLAEKAQLFLLVDQFEALFLQPETARNAFKAEWDLCVPGLALNVHWLFSVPTGFTYLLSMFKEKAAVNPNLITLHFLERGQAHQALVAQGSLRGIQIDEPAVNAILDELAAGHEARIDPVQLQLVGYMLAGANGPLVTHWTMDYYTSQGRAGGILRDYLDRTIGSFEPPEREPAWQLLSMLIDDPDSIATETELIQKMNTLDIDEETTHRVLLDLRSCRLVEYTSAYKLANDCLRPQIQSWREKRNTMEKAREEVARQIRGIGGSALRGLLGGGIGFMLAYWVLPYVERVPITDPFFLTWYSYNLALRLAVGAWTGFLMILAVDLILASFHGRRKVFRTPIATLAGAFSLGLALVLHTILQSFAEDLPSLLPRASIEGMLWGASIGAATLWTIQLDQLPRFKLLAGLAASLVCGVILAVSDAFLQGLNVSGTFFIIFIAGTLMPFFLIGSTLLGKPPSMEG